MGKTAETPVIYIVDDDDDVRCGLTRLIRSLGLRAQPYASAEVFLGDLTGGENGCILLDITMPVLTGQQVLEQLSERGSRIPVIVISARDDDVTRNLARNHGAKMFLSKPVDDQALIDAINWATGGLIGAMR